MSDFGPSGGFARHEAKSGEQGEGQSLREKLSRDRPGSNLCGFCGGDGRIPTPAGLFSGFRGCCPKLVWAAALAVELCGFCCADARTAYSRSSVRRFPYPPNVSDRSGLRDSADSVVFRMHRLVAQRQLSVHDVQSTPIRLPNQRSSGKATHQVPGMVALFDFGFRQQAFRLPSA